MCFAKSVDTGLRFDVGRALLVRRCSASHIQHTGVVMDRGEATQAGGESVSQAALRRHYHRRRPRDTIHRRANNRPRRPPVDRQRSLLWSPTGCGGAAAWDAGRAAWHRRRPSADRFEMLAGRRLDLGITSRRSTTGAGSQNRRPTGQVTGNGRSGSAVSHEWH